MSEFGLVFAFRDPSPSYVHGFACGGIWQRMKTRESFTETVVEELREDIIAMATACGYVETFDDIGSGWLNVTLTPEIGHVG